jgi:hypothetical protein
LHCRLTPILSFYLVRAKSATTMHPKRNQRLANRLPTIYDLTDPDLPLAFRFDAGPSDLLLLRAAPVLGGHLRRIIKVVYTAAREYPESLFSIANTTYNMTRKFFHLTMATFEPRKVDIILSDTTERMETDRSQSTLYIPLLH